MRGLNPPIRKAALRAGPHDPRQPDVSFAQETKLELNPMAFIAVRTTGIFCRPDCPTPPPHPTNVERFERARDALVSGFRPCRRCHPLAGRDAPEWVRQAVSTVEATPEAASGVDENDRISRWLEREHGITLAGYRRLRRLTPVIRSARRARRHRSGAHQVVTTLIDTPLGPMLAGATDAGLCLLEFADRPMLPTQLAIVRRRLGPIVAGHHRDLDQLATELDEYFAGSRTAFEVPIDAPGSPFQQRVWQQLRQIPHGSTASYAALAHELGRSGAARAVGRANGSNRVAIVIPCHRVIAADGGLGGYGGGLDRKRWLLDLERGSSSVSTSHT
jgi:AraC family transcriptional regulator of adaptative response/methylated-DNA-[protein]-cysteine methyltransferase